MIVQHYKNTCLVCGTSWGVDKNSRRISALYSVSSTLNPLNADAVQDDTAVTRTVQGLHSHQWMSGCPNCGHDFGEQAARAASEAVDEAVERIRARQAELRERFVEQEHFKKEIRIAKSVGSVCIIAELIGLGVMLNREKSRRAGADTAEGRSLEGEPAAENPAGDSVLKDNSTRVRAPRSSGARSGQRLIAGCGSIKIVKSPI